MELKSLCFGELDFIALHSLYHEYNELCMDKSTLLGLYKLTAFLSSSQIFARVPFGPALKKMLNKTPKAKIYFDPEAQDFEGEEAVSLNVELIPGE